MTVYWYHDNQRALADTLDASEERSLSNRGSRQENYQVLRQTKVPCFIRIRLY